MFHSLAVWWQNWHHLPILIYLIFQAPCPKLYLSRYTSGDTLLSKRCWIVSGRLCFRSLQHWLRSSVFFIFEEYRYISSAISNKCLIQMQRPTNIMWPQFIYQKFKMKIFSPLKHWQSSLLMLIQCTRKENKRIKFSFLNRPFTCCTEFLYKISGNKLYWHNNWRMMRAGRWFCLPFVSSRLQTFLLTLWMTICHTCQ